MFTTSISAGIIYRFTLSLLDTDINNVECNIDIETYYLTGTTMVFFI